MITPTKNDSTSQPLSPGPETAKKERDSEEHHAPVKFHRAPTSESSDRPKEQTLTELLHTVGEALGWEAEDVRSVQSTLAENMLRTVRALSLSLPNRGKS